MKKPKNFKSSQKRSLQHLQAFDMPKQAQKRFWHHSYGPPRLIFSDFRHFSDQKSIFEGRKKSWRKIRTISKLLRNTFFNTYKRLEHLNMLRIVFDVALTAHQHRFFQFLTPWKRWNTAQRTCSWDLRMMTENDLGMFECSKQSEGLQRSVWHRF